MRKWRLILPILAVALIGGAFIIDKPAEPTDIPETNIVTLGAAKTSFENKPDKFERREPSTLKDAGQNKIEIMKDEPKVVFSKWNDEVRLGVKYAKVKGEGQANGDKIEWKDEKEEVHAYPLPAGEGMEDGGFEIEIVLNEKPDTNKFDFEIDGAENLDFAYQSLEYCNSEGVSCSENVVGSIAVYHKEKKNHVLGEKNYATGKAYHIYRPKAFDANGVAQWAELAYENGILSVTVPQEFLDNAVYPVRVDPTFGQTAIGASNLNNTVDVYVGSDFAVAEDGILDSIQYYPKTASGDDGPSELGFFSFVSDTAGNFLENNTEGAFTPVPDTWNEKDFGDFPFSAGTFWLIHWGEEISIASDTLVNGGVSDALNYPGTWVNFSDGSTQNSVYSIYATYTADTPPPAPPATPPANLMKPIHFDSDE